MTSVDRNVAILFDKNLTDELIRLSQLLNTRIPSRIVLNQVDQIPHLTLYMTKFPEKNIKKVLERLKKIASETKSFILKLNAKSCRSSGTIFIDAEMSDDLYSLHERLVNELNPLREGLYNEDEAHLPGSTAKTIQSLIKYGMWAVKKDYLPHVSIGRIDNPKADGKTALAVIPNEVEYQTIFDRVSFVVRGPHGTCKKVLNTFPFVRV